MDTGAVSPLHHARQSSPVAIRRRQLYRRRARLCRMPHGTSRLAADASHTCRRAALGDEPVASRARCLRGARTRTQASFHMPRCASRLACAVPRLQSRASGRDRGRSPGEPLTSSASRRGRGGACPPRNHCRQDGRTGGGRSLELAEGQGGTGLRRYATREPDLQAIPVIDLMGGQVVRARMGDRASYRPLESPLSPTSDPVDVVRGLLSVFPFATFYVADLDAIQGSGHNCQTLRRIRAEFPSLQIWVDNGVAVASAFDAFIGAGLGTPVIGSESQRDGKLIAQHQELDAHRALTRFSRRCVSRAHRRSWPNQRFGRSGSSS